METKANYVIVGIFTIVAILAAFGFVYWTATIGGRGETAPLRVRIRARPPASPRQRGQFQRRQGGRRQARLYRRRTIRRWRSPTPRSTGLPRSPNRPRPTSPSPASAAKPTSSCAAPTRRAQLLDEAEARHGRRNHRQAVGGHQPPADRAEHLQSRRQVLSQPRGVRRRRPRPLTKRSRTPRNSRRRWPTMPTGCSASCKR